MKRLMEFTLNGKKVVLSYNRVSCSDQSLKEMFNRLLVKARKEWPNERYFLCYLYNQYLSEFSLTNVAFRMKDQSRSV